VEAGRTLELEALVGAVVELGRITDTPTPTIEAIYAVTKLLGQTLQTRGGI
jgi:2-dehydropantoate 2-reductase